MLKIDDDHFQLTPEEDEEASQLFNRFDETHDGKVTIQELKTALTELASVKWTFEDLGKLMARHDDGDGELSLEEFKRLRSELKVPFSAALLENEDCVLFGLTLEHQR